MSSPLSTTRRAQVTPTGSPRARRLVVPALVACAVLIFAACSSSSSDSDSTSSSSSTDATTGTTDSNATADVETADNSDLGTILVDADGFTLYTLTNGGNPVECTGGCLAAWPAVLLAAGTDTPTGGDGVTGLGTVSTSEGEQITHDSLPLYRFAGDSGAGDATGDGISSFGGVWSVVKVGTDAAS